MEQVLGSIMRYDWGSSTALPELLGVDGDGQPWAELWFGTHPVNPSSLAIGGSLRDVAGELPYLAKFLAAAAPLSLQVHPTDEQAQIGYRREERLGIPLTAPTRTYRDRSAKPELLIAVTPFEALCGFRPVEEAARRLRSCGAGTIADLVESSGMVATATRLLTERPALEIDDPLFERLDRAYPGDPGALVALLLNRVDLAPGDAIFLPAGQLHMYLEGLGVEVMGASDNVVRGGLTTKHVDSEQLTVVVDPMPKRPQVQRPDASGWYDIATDRFAVQRLVGPVTVTARAPELMVVVEGTVAPMLPGTAWYLAPGESAALTTALTYRVTTGPSN